MQIPSSTYRVQLHSGFTFKDLYKIIDYLHALGISTIYGSPIFQASPGSMHGYDVVDPHRISNEIGTIDEFRLIRKKLKEKNMSWIQDIVPNHMAYHKANARLMDVMERGNHSPYYRYFDIDWDHPYAHLNAKLQVPILGDHLDVCLARGEITVSFSVEGFSVNYFEDSFPLSLPAVEHLFRRSSGDVFPYRDFIAMGGSTHHYEDWRSDKESYLSAIINDGRTSSAINNAITELNNDPQRLKQVLDRAYYTLCYWKDTDREINYRRFFTVNQLICLRMEDEGVFYDYHKFVHELYSADLIQGLRVDHIDGLYDPGEYLRRLRSLFGDKCFIIAEKILEPNEHIPSEWPLQGTSGYEFLSHVSQLITRRSGAYKLVEFYRQLVPSLPSYGELVTNNKRLILERHMGGEWENLLFRAARIPSLKRFSESRLKEALGVLMVAMPVYRIYPERIPLEGEGADRMREAHLRAEDLSPDLVHELDALHELWMAPPNDRIEEEAILAFLRRLMQFTGPLTAKGVEDTTFYVYNALIAHDEVGDAPSQQGISIDHFHSRMLERLSKSPFSLNTTATHDTKRGEDARLRLTLIAEYPDEWKTLVLNWINLNGYLKREINGVTAPSVNDEYYIYQAITGGFPDDLTLSDEWIARLIEYETKVLREAKVHTHWSEPNEAYEQACTDFIRGILHSKEFMESFLPFIATLIDRSRLSTLAQVALKITAPGVPDTYQGCELWDLSFVDPDNRRPVDYSLRADVLQEIQDAERQGVEVVNRLIKENRGRGYEKFFAVYKLLNFRRVHADLFAKGDYLPLPVEGDTSTVAFARGLDSTWVVVIVPLAAAANTTNKSRIHLPLELPRRWKNVFSAKVVEYEGDLALGASLDGFPVTVLTNDL